MALISTLAASYCRYDHAPCVQRHRWGLLRRADDARRGGDIDLLIETELCDPAQIARAHTQFLARVYTALGEQKIDVLIDYPARQSQSPIYEVARHGVLL